MNCARLHQVLDAYVDGELDHATSNEINAHIAECSACAVLHEQRMALQQALREHAPYFKAPATLMPTLRQRLAQSESPAPSRAAGAPWFHVAVFATAAALAGLVGGYWFAQPQPDYLLRDPAVASHIAALAPKRQLIEIASSDRHTVKPWFQGRIDFAPPVKDLAGEGFILLGARLDRVADKSAAAVVYRVRKHVINLFVWRATDPAPDAIATSTVRGFSVATWAADGLRFAAVSDVESNELTRFAQLIGNQ